MTAQITPPEQKRSLFGRFVWFVVKVFGAFLALIVLAIIALNIYLSTRPDPRTVRAAGTIKVPAPFRVGRPFIDYMTISGPRLYAGYASAGLVGVVDLATSQPAGTVSGFGRTHGVAIVAGRNLGFASDSGDGSVGVFDLNTLRLLQKIPAGIDTDAIIYDPKLNLVYAANHDGKTATLIDPATLKVVANIPLGGEPEYPQADPATGIIYQNLEDTSELVVVDPPKAGGDSALQTRSLRRPDRACVRCRRPPLVFRLSQQAFGGAQFGHRRNRRGTAHRGGRRWRGLRPDVASCVHRERRGHHDRNPTGFRRSIPRARKCANAFRRAFAGGRSRHASHLRRIFRIHRRVRSSAITTPFAAPASLPPRCESSSQDRRIIPWSVGGSPARERRRPARANSGAAQRLPLQSRTFRRLARSAPTNGRHA